MELIYLAVDVETTADNMVTVLKAMTTPAFDDVWLGNPQLVPMGNKYVATVQAVEDDHFEDNVCPTHYSSQTTFYVYVEVAGTVNIATKNMYSATKDVVDAFKATPTFMGGCNGSSITGVQYGEFATSEDKRLVAVGRVEVVCDYAY